MGFWGIGNLIDKLGIVNYSKPALVVGLVIMLFFGAFPYNQNALAGIVNTNTDIEVVVVDGVFFPFLQFFPAFDDFCLEHWHADDQFSVFSLDGFFELFEPTEHDGPDGEDCGWLVLPGPVITVTLCDSPGAVCRGLAGSCDIAEVCTSDGFCPDDTFITQATTPCQENSQLCAKNSFCDGSGPSCPGITFLPAGTVCQVFETAECKADSICDSVGTCLPAFKENETPCGNPLNTECNLADTCVDGVCTDNFLSEEVRCGGDPAPGTCEAVDRCDGAGLCEPKFQASGTMCGDFPAPGTCEAFGQCDGASIAEPILQALNTMCGLGASPGTYEYFGQCNRLITCLL